MTSTLSELTEFAARIHAFIASASAAAAGGAPPPTGVAGCALAASLGAQTHVDESADACVPPGFSARARKTAPEGGCAPRPAAASDFNTLALELFALQVRHNVALRGCLGARGQAPERLRNWREIPPVPVAAFKEVELTALPAEACTTVFHSSGTTGQKPSRHFHSAESLRLYEASLRPWFWRHLWPEGAGGRGAARLRQIILTPPPAQVPHSSLVHMFATVTSAPEDAASDLVEEFHPRGEVRDVAENRRLALGQVGRSAFRRQTPRQPGTLDLAAAGAASAPPPEGGTPNRKFFGTVGADGGWCVDFAAALADLRAAAASGAPVMLLGTAFSFVHLLDHFAAAGISVKLPSGSRVLETGGYKGRSRTLPKAELHAEIARRLGVPASHIVCEYGMSELSSQAYDTMVPTRADVARQARRFHFPPWARAVVVSPETGVEVGESETGLLRIYDLANVWSALAVQTEDLGVRRGEGFELLGRAAEAEPRGCSRMTD